MTLFSFFGTSITFWLNYRWWFNFWCGPCCKGHKPFNTYSGSRAKRCWWFCPVQGCWKDHHIAFHKHHCWWTTSFSWRLDMVKQFALNILTSSFHTLVLWTFIQHPSFILTCACLISWLKCWIICFPGRFCELISWNDLQCCRCSMLWSYGRTYTIGILGKISSYAVS